MWAQGISRLPYSCKHKPRTIFSNITGTVGGILLSPVTWHPVSFLLLIIGWELVGFAHIQSERVSWGTNMRKKLWGHVRSCQSYYSSRSESSHALIYMCYYPWCTREGWVLFCSYFHGLSLKIISTCPIFPFSSHDLTSLQLHLQSGLR